MKENTKRLDYIDCAKGIGILLVVVGHHLQDSEPILRWIYSFHMPLFFIVTGYLYAGRDKKSSVTEAIMNGTRNLLYPYLTLSTVVILWWAIFGFVFQSQPEESINNIILRTITTYGYHAMWFLPTMFQVSVVSKIISQKSRLIWLVFAIALAAGMSYLADSMTDNRDYWRYLIMYIGRFLSAFSFVEIGRYLRAGIARISSKMEWITILLTLAISLFLSDKNILVSMAFARMGDPVVYYLTSCAGSICVLLLSKKIATNWIGRKLCYWGRNSLVVMALHMDISIEIAWIILSVTKLSNVVSFRTASILAILIEMVLLVIIIELINRYAVFLIRLPRKTIVSKEK